MTQTTNLFGHHWLPPLNNWNVISGIHHWLPLTVAAGLCNIFLYLCRSVLNCEPYTGPVKSNVNIDSICTWGKGWFKVKNKKVYLHYFCLLFIHEFPLYVLKLTTVYRTRHRVKEGLIVAEPRSFLPWDVLFCFLVCGRSSSLKCQSGSA